VPSRSSNDRYGLYPVLRLLVGIAAAILLGLGLLALLTGNPEFLSLILIGGVGLVAALWERSRYRSAAAERDGATPGPGGGEADERLDPRFRSTDERFVDPTSGRVMRVFIDPQTGERRYRAE
jgi:hypothetical protein